MVQGSSLSQGEQAGSPFLCGISTARRPPGRGIHTRCTMSPRTQLWAPCALVLLLAACGGGSSSDTPSASDTPAPDAPMTTDPGPTTPGSLDPVPDRALGNDPFGTSFEAESVHDAGALHAAVVRNAIAAAAVPPHLGSVTQSASGQAATATTDGRSFAVTIPGLDGGTLTLDTATDAVWRENELGSRFSNEDAVQEATLFRSSGGTSTLVTEAGIWVGSDPDDYLLLGYWLHLDGDLSAQAAMNTVTAAAAGAFVDGPEFRLANRPTMPALGTASYAGRSSGFYSLEYGNGGSRAGRTEAGRYFADVALTADFAASTIQGCIGCQRDGETATGPYDGWHVEGVYADPQTGLHETADYHDDAGYTDTPESAPARFMVRLGATPFNPDGTFLGTAVTLENAGPDAIVQSSGDWGGMFSSILDASGEPRSVAGTVGAEGTTADGSQLAVIGSFYTPAE